MIAVKDMRQISNEPTFTESSVLAMIDEGYKTATAISLALNKKVHVHLSNLRRKGLVYSTEATSGDHRAKEWHLTSAGHRSWTAPNNLKWHEEVAGVPEEVMREYQASF